MTRREKVSAVLAALGLLLQLGAVGSMECNGQITILDIVKAAIGMILLFVSVPISGDLKVSENGEEQTAPDTENGGEQM